MNESVSGALGAKGLRIRLYIAGDSPNSARAIENLRTAIATLALAPDEVEIIDVLRSPQRGLRDGVFVTPLLLRASPAPERRILGNLADRALLLAVLSVGGGQDG